jgi:hypothetical protein
MLTFGAEEEQCAGCSATWTVSCWWLLEGESDIVRVYVRCFMSTESTVPVASERGR